MDSMLFGKRSAGLLVFTAMLLLIASTTIEAHSQMRCAKYDKVSKTCSAPIRDAAESFSEEAYLYTNGAPICQKPMTNPISASYANGRGCPDYAPCPDPMGTYAPGEQFTVMWFARNHATADQDPATVFLYLSPQESSSQGSDVSAATMKSNLICSGPFMNCGGVNQDMTPCTLTCTMPTSVASGIHTLWWKWDWQGTMYTTCADINISGSGSGSSGSSSSGSSTTAAAPKVTTSKPSTPATTAPIRSATTAAIKPVTTSKAQSSTTTSTTTTGKPSSTTTTTTTTGKPSSTSTSSSTTTGNPSGNMCYLPGTPNLGGKISSTGTCGKRAPRNRCAEGECCSQWGYCGATSQHCDNTVADYRKVPCDSIVSGINALSFSKQEGSSSTIMNVIQLRWIVLFGILLAVLPLRWN